MNLGYACINMSLSTDGISTNRGMIKKTYEAKGKIYASELALKNLEDLFKVLEWNTANGIKVYRMSSCLFPWMSRYEFSDLPNYTEIKNICVKIGKYATETGQRISFHPGHFNILASPSTSTSDNSILDLTRHAEIMDMMELPTNGHNTINIHVGGAYGDKPGAIARFCENFAKLPMSAQKRLTIENDDKANMYSTKELYEGIHKKINIPIVFDFFHHQFCTGGQTVEEALRLAATTWPTKIKQLTHYASSKKINEDSTAKYQAHADYIYEKIDNFGVDIDIELECKAKELALMKYLKDYN